MLSVRTPACSGAALPMCTSRIERISPQTRQVAAPSEPAPGGGTRRSRGLSDCAHAAAPNNARSEEHTSELQSLRHLVCRLLLDKKKTRPAIRGREVRAERRAGWDSERLQRPGEGAGAPDDVIGGGVGGGQADHDRALREG